MLLRLLNVFNTLNTYKLFIGKTYKFQKFGVDFSSFLNKQNNQCLVFSTTLAKVVQNYWRGGFVLGHPVGYIYLYHNV